MLHRGRTTKVGKWYPVVVHLQCVNDDWSQLGIVGTSWPGRLWAPAASREAWAHTWSLVGTGPGALLQWQAMWDILQTPVGSLASRRTCNFTPTLSRQLFLLRDALPGGRSPCWMTSTGSESCLSLSRGNHHDVLLLLLLGRPHGLSQGLCPLETSISLSGSTSPVLLVGTDRLPV